MLTRIAVWFGLVEDTHGAHRLQDLHRTRRIMAAWEMAAWMCAIVSMVIALVLALQMGDLRRSVQRACAPDSVIAQLDLVEWIEPCTKVR